MKEDLFSLKGRVAIVTGGNGGIGKGIAESLAAAGADIVIAARNEIKTEKAAQDIRDSSGGRILGYQIDIGKDDEIQELVNTVREKLGRIDILVNNAGMSIRKMPQEYDIREWDEVLDINLRAPFLFCQSVYPLMKSGGKGKIINIGSMYSIFGGAKVNPYATSKGGIVQMTKSLAIAWAPDNIQVNAMLPGWIDTELTRQARKDIPGLHERVEARTPVGRWGVPSDLTGAAVFLASDASDFVTGVALPVDGGFSVFL